MEYYYYGQGKVWSRRLNEEGAGWRWWGDVSALTLALELEKLQHKESYSGNKGIARDFAISKAMTVNATLHQADTDSLAEQLYGEVSTVASGAVTGESLGTVAAGDVFKLAYPGGSALVITDSTPVTPLTIADTHYQFDGRFSSLEFLSLPGGPPVMPLKAAYSYAGHKQVGMFTKPQPIIEFRYEGVNLAEGNAPVIVEIYRMSTDPLKELALINNDTSLAGMPVSCAAQIDTSKPATGTLGQFGRIIQLAA
ncbi:MAG: hypothetical protein IAE86_06525 [Burkholderiaceae bacterium]|nr:hypothetical protein [Burkholderiaceae bacterium]